LTDITRWTEGELETFSHKLEQIISGPNPKGRSPGFIMIAFPLNDQAKARMMSNCDGQVVLTVLYKILQGLVDREPKQ
jgi:hypothetical protein